MKKIEGQKSRDSVSLTSIESMYERLSESETVNIDIGKLLYCTLGELYEKNTYKKHNTYEGLNPVMIMDIFSAINHCLINRSY
jgi:hypothetical protein